MPTLPTGTVTFLFTDIESSTRLWETDPESMRAALAHYDALVAGVVAAHDGLLVRSRGEGDSSFAVFRRASEAVVAAAAIQQALRRETPETPFPLRVRIGVHTGEADLREGDYYGREVNRCARVRSLAHGGQTLLSQTTADLVRRTLPPNLQLRPLGPRRLRDLRDPEHVYELVSTEPTVLNLVRRVASRLAEFPRRPAAIGTAVAGAALLMVLVALRVGGLPRRVAPDNVPPAVAQSSPTAPGLPASPSPTSPYARVRRSEASALHPSGIMLQIVAGREVLTASEPLPLSISLINPHAANREVEFPMGQLFDVVVTGVTGPDAGQKVYQWSEGQVFSGEPRMVEWRPGQELLYTVEWQPPYHSPTVRATYRISAIMLAEVPVQASLDVSIGD